METLWDIYMGEERRQILLVDPDMSLDEIHLAQDLMKR